jgi:hypothetical protein
MDDHAQIRWSAAVTGSLSSSAIVPSPACISPMYQPSFMRFALRWKSSIVISRHHGQCVSGRLCLG